jgi:hypothetical protein
MKRLKGFKKTPPVLILLLISSALLFYTVHARADDAEQSNQNFRYVTLLSGNNINVVTTQITPFGVHSVFVTSIGNRTLTANVSNLTASASGLWFVSLFGTGGVKWADSSLGVIPATSPAAQIDIGREVSFALATVTLFVTSPVDAENPVSCTMKIAP